MPAKKATTKATKTTKATAKRAKQAPAKKTQPPAAETKVETTADAKPAKTMKPAKEQVPGKLSALDAAAKVLDETGTPMTAKAMIEAMATKGYWSSPGGQTPHATLYAAIIREINVKGVESRFAKVDRGQFALASATTVPTKPAAKATGKKKTSKKSAPAGITDETPVPETVSEPVKN